MKRKIIKIDEEKCTGCGLCVPSCAEGALQIIDGKARLVSEIYCDGLGACLGDCPEGALTIEEREAEEFDEKAVQEHLAEMEERKDSSQEKEKLPCGCPSSQSMSWEKVDGEPVSKSAPTTRSKLRQWPVQLTLVNPDADYFKGAELLIAADCIPFAYASFHHDFLQGKAVVVGCPKLDDYKFYVNKLTEIIKRGSVKKIHVVNMEVPCCFGLMSLVREALARAGRNIPVEQVVVSIKGEIIERKRIPSSSSSLGTSVL
ncbi:MAG: 4Fe-4S binding protein [Candidatus Aminicenantaceae bacterium]